VADELMVWLPQRVCVASLLPTSCSPSWGLAGLQVSHNQVAAQLHAHIAHTLACVFWAECLVHGCNTRR
jgi:hypothetical protein